MLGAKRLQQLGVHLKLIQTTQATFSLSKNMAHLTNSSGGTSTSKCGPILTKHLPEGADPRQVVKEFMATVNMQPREIEEFLTTENSRKAAELTEDDAEHEGRHLARRICELLEKVGERKNDPHAYELSLLYEADLQQMYQVTDYIKCHLETKKEKEKQGEKMDSMWRYRLMNCGYDPLKEEKKQAAERQEM